VTGTRPVIDRMSVEPFSVPLGRPWGEDVRRLHFVVVRIGTSDGASGTGFSWTPTIGATALAAILRDDIRDRVLGRAPEPGPVWDGLWHELHEAGGGLATMAMAGVDLALWDRQARCAASTLVDFLGRRRASVPVYGSGVNLHYTIDELAGQVERWVAAGFDAVKVKVGKPDLAEDVDRIEAVRQVLGPRRRLMIDANQRWDLPRARRAITELSRFDLDWVEEPLASDDLRAHADLRSSVGVPIALGENLHSIYRFREALELGACDVVQPNVVRVGGITPFLRIAHLARAHSVQVAPHLLPELSGQLALTLPDLTSVEWVEDAGFDDLGVLDGPLGVRPVGGRLNVETGPGLGFTFPQPR